MKIETKFNIGDSIFFIPTLSIKKVRIIQSRIQGIKIDILHNERLVTYLCNEEADKQINLKVFEEDAFKTKEELLATL